MRVLILEWQPLFTEALRQLLLRLGNQVFIRVAGDIKQGIELLEHEPMFDLIFLDLELPGLDDFGFMRLLQDRFVNPPVIVFAADDDSGKSQQLIRQVARGYVHKSAGVKTVLSAIYHVLAGDIYCPDDCKPAANISVKGKINPGDMGISERQFAALLLLEQGFSNKEIARAMGISESTIKTHVSCLISALAVHNRTACVLEARRIGLL